MTGLRVALVCVALVGCHDRSASGPVTLVAPWTTLGLPLDGAKLVECTPTRLRVTYTDDAEHDAIGHAFGRRLRQYGYRVKGVANSDSYPNDNRPAKLAYETQFEADKGGVIWHRDDPAKRTLAFELRGSLPPPLYAVSWGGEVGIYDVLPRDPKQLGLVQVARRTPAVRRDARFPLATIETKCGDRWCVDGLRTTDNPKSGISPFVLDATPDGDEQDALGSGSSSWLERGVSTRMVRTERPERVILSFVVGQAWFTDGAAHSNSSLECRTDQLQPGSPYVLSLAGAVGDTAASMAQQAADDFLADAGIPQQSEPLGYLLDEDPDTVVFCVPDTTHGDKLRFLRVHFALPHA